MDSQGYAWNNLMLQHWTDHNDVEHLVKDDYERNRHLIDLSQQPDNIIESVDCTIKEGVSTNAINNVGIHFLRFCGKYELINIAKFPEQYGNWLNKTYKGVLHD
jgi:hypothetical protein